MLLKPARGALLFVVTLTTFKDVRSYPCRSLESATKMAERFVAGVTKPSPAASLEAIGFFACAFTVVATDNTAAGFPASAGFDC